MPLKIQNYGNWEGDRKGGHHPPNCTCYGCNEGQWDLPRPQKKNAPPTRKRAKPEPARNREKGKGNRAGRIIGAAVAGGIVAATVLIVVLAA